MTNEELTYGLNVVASDLRTLCYDNPPSCGSWTPSMTGWVNHDGDKRVFHLQRATGETFRVTVEAVTAEGKGHHG